MEWIATFENKIDEELADACEYAELYLHLKDSNSDIATKLKNISLQEQAHYETLNSIMQHFINDEKMQNVFNYLHTKNNKKLAEVKTMLNM